MYTLDSCLGRSISNKRWDLNVLLRNAIADNRCGHFLDSPVEVILELLH